MSLFNELNAQNNVLRAAMRGHAKRNEVIVNNIANADVPGFRARRVEFEDALKDAVGAYPHPRHRTLDVSGVTPTTHLQTPGFFYRIDGNNVDIEVEMVKLFQNSMQFETMAASIQSNSERMRTVFQQ